MLELSLMGQGTSSKQPKGGKDLFRLLVSEGSVFDSADSEPVVKRNRMVTGNMWQRLLTSRQTGNRKGPVAGDCLQGHSISHPSHLFPLYKIPTLPKISTYELVGNLVVQP